MDEPVRRRWQERVAYLLGTDPGGGFVAEDAGRIVGVARGGQDRAIDVGLRAGLDLSAYGALCVRGRPGPLRPFVPSGAFG